MSDSEAPTPVPQVVAPPDHRTTMRALGIAIDARVPVVLTGPPGSGKTAAVRELAGERKRLLATIIASLREPTDMAGLPVAEGRETFLAAPAWAKELVREEQARLASKEKDPLLRGAPIVFFDEVSTAPHSVQASLLRVVDEGVVGELPMPEGTSFVAAMNPPDSAAAGWHLAAAFANRWLHLEWIGWSAKEWAAWAIKQGWGDAGRLCGAFVLARPMLLHAMPKEASRRGQPWPSHRTWARGAKVLSLHFEQGGNRKDAVTAALVSGAVGSAAGGEFAEYVTQLDLPDPRELLAHPDKWQVPQRSDQIWATITAVVDYVLSTKKAKDWERGWDVFARCLEPDSEGITHGDIAVAVLGEYAKRVPDGARTELANLGAFEELLVAAGLLKRRRAA